MKPIAFLLTCLSLQTLQAQEATIELGPNEIGANEGWTITVTVRNEGLKSYSGFPDIPGFAKRGTSSQSQTSIMNGRMSSSQSIVMTYVPQRQGVIAVPGFSMKINDKTVSVQGMRVTVGPPVEQAPDPFSRFFGDDPSSGFFGRGKTEYVDTKEEAQLALSVSKEEVYVGEGVTVGLSFLIAESNRAPMQFYQLGQQLTDILKKLRPANCWEENFNIENIEGQRVNIGGRIFTQYKIYQGTFFPLNSDPVVFPSFGLKMIKYKVAKNPSFFGNNHQEDYKTFYSKPKTVRVKNLPPHPLSERVAVGNYKLEEKLNGSQFETGQSAGYEFAVTGEGNISGIAKPALQNNANFDFYEPNVRQLIRREHGTVTGTKTFNYFLIPKEPGTFPLKDYFQWIYFNPKSKKYDTLKSSYVLNVTGDSFKNNAIEAADAGSFYNRIEEEDNTLCPAQDRNWQRIIAYAFMALITGAVVSVLIRKRA